MRRKWEDLLESNKRTQYFPTLPRSWCSLRSERNKKTCQSVIECVVCLGMLSRTMTSESLCCAWCVGGRHRWQPGDVGLWGVLRLLQDDVNAQGSVPPHARLQQPQRPPRHGRPGLLPEDWAKGTHGFLLRLAWKGSPTVLSLLYSEWPRCLSPFLTMQRDAWDLGVCHNSSCWCLEPNPSRKTNQQYSKWKVDGKYFWGWI